MMKREILAVAVAAVAVTAAAQQNLKTEIDVDRTIVPQYRDVDRPSAITPNLLPTPTMSAQLNAAEYLSSGNATSTMSLLPAAAWADSIPLTPYRGYASLGYFPSMTIGANAGYRVIDNAEATLGLWLQYSGTSYKADSDWESDYLYSENLDGECIVYETPRKIKTKRHFLTLGADGAVRLGASSLTYGVDYMHAIVGWTSGEDYGRNADRLGVNLRWDSRIGNVAYDVKGRFGHFGYSKKDLYMAPKQTSGLVGVGVGYCHDDEAMPWIGADIDVEMLRTARLNVVPKPIVSMTQTRIAPYYRYCSGLFNARVGINVSLAGGNRIGKAVHVAPDVRLDVATPQFSAYLHATGGQHLNSNERMYMLNPYALPHQAYERTNVPVDLRLGIGVGPFSGLSFGVYVQYAMVRDWYSPSYAYYGWLLHDKMDCSRVGVSARYQYGSLVSVDAAYTMAIKGTDGFNTWYEWGDGARGELQASLTVRPITPLSLTLGYHLRSQRKIKFYAIDICTYGMLADDNTYDIGDISDLDLRADYRVTPAITVFAIGQNLLNHRYQLPCALPAQGLTGSIGVAAKF